MRSLTKESNSSNLLEPGSTLSNFSLPMSLTLSLAWIDNLFGITPTTRQGSHNRDACILLILIIPFVLLDEVRTSTWLVCFWYEQIFPIHLIHYNIVSPSTVSIELTVTQVPLVPILALVIQNVTGLNTTIAIRQVQQHLHHHHNIITIDEITNEGTG